MKNKIILIVLIVLFIAGLVLASVFINKVSYAEKNEEVKLNELQEIKTESQEEIDLKTSNAVLEVTEEDFEAEVLNSDKIVLIDFYADWCGPCQMLSPLVDEVANENPDFKFVRIDVDANQNLANKYRIIYMPTLVLIENGEELDRLVGLVEKNTIEEFVKMGQPFLAKNEI